MIEAVFIVVGALIFLLLGVVNWFVERRRKGKTLSYLPRSQFINSPRKQVARSDQVDAAFVQLRSKVVQMCGWDEPLANRLIAHVRSNHPGKSDKWVLEKVILDLERDRRT